MARPRRLVGGMAAVGLAAVGLAACGGPSATVLTNSALPANLKLQQNNSDVARNLATVFNKTYPGCTGTYAVFTLHGRTPTPPLSGTIYPQVYSESATCPDVATAQSVFSGVVKRVTTFGATTLSGIGDGAILATSKSETGNAHSYVIFWRDGAVLASVQLSGPTSDHLITVAETRLLAHRQIALQ